LVLSPSFLLYAGTRYLSDARTTVQSQSMCCSRLRLFLGLRPFQLHVAHLERDDKLRELEEADRAVFVATLVGARDKRKELHPPWRPS
jgi:hypothetical protein